MQDVPKAVWSILYVSEAFFPSLKQNFIAYRSFKVSWRPECIFEIPYLWQSGFCRVYSNFCCSCSFQPEIIQIGQSSHKMYSNNILNSQESTTILNASTKKSGNLLKSPRICLKVNVLARLVFEFVYYDSAVLRFNHCTTRILPAVYKVNRSNYIYIYVCVCARVCER